MTPISVAVADGQRTFADALAARLAAEPGIQVVTAASSAAEARRLLVGRQADIMLLDCELPGGLDLAAELAGPRVAVGQPVRVIMLGGLPEPARLVEALRAGVRGWVTKENSIHHLTDVIRGIMRDEAWLPPQAVGVVLGLLLRQTEDGAVEGPLAKLTPREREVLTYLSQGIGRREVAERMQLSANTIRSHLQNLMAKLEVHSTLEAVAIARQSQLCKAPPTSFRC